MLWGSFIFRVWGNAVTDVLFGLGAKFGIQLWRTHGYTLGMKCCWKINVVMVRSAFKLPQTQRRRTGKFCSILTSALRRVVGQRHATAAWPPERPGIHYAKGWVGSRTRLNGRTEEKVTFPPPGSYQNWKQLDILRLNPTNLLCVRNLYPRNKFVTKMK